MKPTNAQKVKAVSLVLYEIWMLVESLRAWKLHPFPDTDQSFIDIVNNWKVESTLVHARIMDEFFRSSSAWRKQRRTDDIISEDYGFGPFESCLSQDIRDRLNKDLSHLSYSRLAKRTAQQKRWSPKDFRSVVESCQKFLDHIKEREFLEKFGQLQIEEISRTKQCVDSYLQSEV